MSREPPAFDIRTAIQAGLFANESASPVFDECLSTDRRTALDATSWIEVVPGWLSGSQLVLNRLKISIPFEQHKRRLFNQVFLEPRLTANMPDLADAPEGELRDAAHILSRHYGVEYDGLWLNLYRQGTDSKGWHRDLPSCRQPL